MDLNAPPYVLTDLARINVLLGKNGCGKSTVLKAADAQSAAAGVTSRYVTPERGGSLVFDPNVENNMLSAAGWLGQSRRVNRFEQFRQQSFIQLRRLELQVLRDREREGIVGDFDRHLQKLNGLLDNIEMRRDEGSFPLYSRATGERLEPTAISSGESELISLGIEILMFAQVASSGQSNVLFLDEPDVHLHPDLQVRLMTFLLEAIRDHPLSVVLATHSTAIVGALAQVADARVCFMRPHQQELAFDAISEVHRRVLPVFGAHPLSNVFNQAPVLLVEGEDDVRIWQQAIRSSQGRLSLFPVACGSVDAMNRYEVEVDKLMSAVYENGRAYSLRDGDGIHGLMNPEGAVTRLRLDCRAAENLLLTDEVLAAAGASWDDVKARVEQWLATDVPHPKRAAVLAFAEAGFDRREHDLKDLRMLLLGEMIASSKPWEVLVGQAIAGLDATRLEDVRSAHSLTVYLGSSILDAVLG
ncbi:AAA family ATPase [Paraconexibacter sp. AEG42_29]|uniref:AAA family ATPase n=1 Tax=Paraconexibacter sp. AEG42_29 TaxID=2997339 RepID=UPI00339D3FA1